MAYYASNSGGASLILGGVAMIPHDLQSRNQNKQKKETQKQYCNKFNEALKMVHIKKSFFFILKNVGGW